MKQGDEFSTQIYMNFCMSDAQVTMLFVIIY